MEKLKQGVLSPDARESWHVTVANSAPAVFDITLYLPHVFTSYISLSGSSLHWVHSHGLG